MSITLPDPEQFGESGPKPWERIDEDEYHSLDEWNDQQ